MPFVIRGVAAMQDRGFRWFFLARAITMVTGSMSSIALAFAVVYAVIALSTLFVPSVWRMGRPEEVLAL